MKPNVDFPKKARNSFIYFQLGLIATMVVVLFVLEFDFKTTKQKIVVDTPDEFEINEPSLYSIISEVKTVVPVKTSNHVPISVFNDVIKPVDVEVPKEIEVAPLATPDKVAFLDEQSQAIPSDNGASSVTKPAEITAFTVESLPMFPACRGISRAEQKACFDEQLAKFVSRYLVYPEEDLENGKQGVAQVEFIIDENGVVSNVVALNNKRATLEMQKAAERAIKRLPKLIPARHGDKAVRIKYTIPVCFRLN